MINKVRKALVKVISYGSTPNTVRVTLYRFCSHYYSSRFTEENIETKYIPSSLRSPNSEFMMVWNNKPGKLIKIEILNNEELSLIKKIIEKYERSLDYLDIKEKQEIDNEYLHFAKDFFNKVLEVNYGYGIVSDKSCLDYYAIAFDESLESYQEKIKLHYNVNISNIINCPILYIIKKINNI